MILSWKGILTLSEIGLCLLQELNVAVFRESGNGLYSVMVPPAWFRVAYQSLWNEETGELKLPCDSFLAAFIVEHHYNPPEKSRSTLFRENLTNREQALTARVTFVPIEEARYYCIETHTELDEYERGLLQRIRSHDLGHTNFGKVTASIGTDHESFND